MPELAMLEAEIIFHTADEGGRQLLPTGVLTGLRYRPHIVLGDVSQRGLVDRDVAAQEEYVGVAFVAGPDQVKPGEPCTVRMTLIYWPNYDYPTVKPGETFTLREGARVVAHGQLKRRWTEQYEPAG
jgi:hypothetical protein